jgi:hypothetical protein
MCDEACGLTVGVVDTTPPVGSVRPEPLAAIGATTGELAMPAQFELGVSRFNRSAMLIGQHTDQTEC